MTRTKNQGQDPLWSERGSLDSRPHPSPLLPSQRGWSTPTTSYPQPSWWLTPVRFLRKQPVSASTEHIMAQSLDRTTGLIQTAIKWNVSFFEFVEVKGHAQFFPMEGTHIQTSKLCTISAHLTNHKCTWLVGVTNQLFSPTSLYIQPNLDLNRAWRTRSHDLFLC